MIYLTFLAAILLSGIAAYYSVIGLAAIFAGAFWPVILMGTALEYSKLITASWLYRNWKTAPILIRSYLTVAVVILMLITSMGIFGFLSKSHIDSTLDAGSNIAELKTLNQQEKIAKERLDYLLARAKDPSTASNRLDKQIQETQKELAVINNKKLPILKENNKLAADVGPIKYVADIFFSDGEGALDKAVRLVIFLIMLVFDPLAVLLLISANISMKNKDVEEKQMPKPQVETDESIKIHKENLATMEDKVQPVNKKSISKLEPKYDYNDEFAFREKENK
jgi:hypothetical protein